MATWIWNWTYNIQQVHIMFILIWGEQFWEVVYLSDLSQTRGPWVISQSYQQLNKVSNGQYSSVHMCKWD